MADNEIDIIVTAQDKASAAINKVTGAVEGMGGAVEESKKKSVSLSDAMTGLNSAFMLADRAVRSVQQAYEATIGATMKYAEQVRDLSAISGESAENTSRFIQVLDDFQVSAEDVTTATRALTKQGLAPTVETLAKLSDEYLAANSAQEKNELILKNLGRAGLQWVNVLQQGGDALRARSGAVEDSLVLDQKALENAEKLRLQQDKLNDAWTATKIAVGNALVPALSNAITYFEATAQAEAQAREEGVKAGLAFYERVRQIRENIFAQQEYAATLDHTSMSMSDVVREMGDLKNATEEVIVPTEELTAANKSFLSSVESITGRLKTYEENVAAVQKELDEGKITLGQAKEKWRELADEQELATHRMILNMLEQQLALGGLTAQETEALLALGVEWGIYSDTAIAELREAMGIVDEYVNRIEGIPSSKTFTLYVYQKGGITFGEFSSGGGGSTGGGGGGGGAGGGGGGGGAGGGGGNPLPNDVLIGTLQALNDEMRMLPRHVRDAISGAV